MVDKNIWVTSDSHFNHSNFLNFKDENGNRIRPFDNVTQMDEFMITKWNETVKPTDKIYHLGDVVYSGRKVPDVNKILVKLNGTKRLILGNHDVVNADLMHYFPKISMWRLFKEFDLVMSHVPLREDSMYKVTFNLHGHIHQNPSPSLRHMNMCVEHHNYTPVHIDDILADLAQRKKQLEQLTENQ